MKSKLMTLLILVCAILVLAVAGYAQEATISGTVTDATGAVLPGVTVTAVLEASGNSFGAVTDARGDFRIPVRIGVYRITAELQGFRAATRTGVELLVGQTVNVKLQMTPAGVAESVTVSAQAALIETSTSSLGTQHRSASGVGAAVAGPELDVARPAGARKPHQRSGRHAGTGPGRRPRVPAQCRWHASDVEPRHWQPVAVQQRFDRGIPVHLEPV